MTEDKAQEKAHHTVPEDMEHQALQSAAMHEWQTFRLQQTVN
jgi:hypothetical protein